MMPVSFISTPDGLSAPALAQAIDAAFGWWRDAGVDGDWGDAPQDWLARPSPAPPAAPPVMVPARAALPADPDAFIAWWMTQADFAPAGATRVPPAGPHAPQVMVVVPMPEAQDSASLLSGAAGRLLDGFLRAAGLARDEVYCAAALPARITAPDWAALAQSGLGAVLLHHIDLVRPQRLIVFGQSGVSTLLGNDSANNPAHLPMINHEGASVPVLWAYDLEAIVARPALKAGLWNRWLEWTSL